MNKAVKWAIAMVIALALGALCTYIPLKRHFKAQIEALKPKVDTLVIRDTLTLEKPIEIERRILVKDSILVPICDTIRIKDSIFVSLPREQKVYGDSSYRAVVSGYRPSLDTISIYSKTTIIDRVHIEKTKPKFSIGVNVGYGATMNGASVSMSPYIGLGVTYNLLSF